MLMNDKIKIEKKVLSENDRLAAQIRSSLSRASILSINLVSSPGSGKTSLLEKTLKALKQNINMAVIAGDVQTENDAVRLRRAGGEIVRPLMTGGACHLDAKMITRELERLDLKKIDILFIENVGNLVCPAGYDLGEDMKIVVISTTEGDDKPLKYPAMFHRSSVMIINKIDLLGLSDFDIEKVKNNALNINSNLKIFEISCKTENGLEQWYDWLAEKTKNKRQLTYQDGWCQA